MFEKYRIRFFSELVSLTFFIIIASGVYFLKDKTSETFKTKDFVSYKQVTLQKNSFLASSSDRTPGHILNAEEVSFYDKQNKIEQENYEQYVVEKYGEKLASSSEFRKRKDGIYFGTEIRYGTLVSQDGVVLEKKPSKDISVYITNDINNFTSLDSLVGKDSSNVYQVFFNGISDKISVQTLKGLDVKSSTLVTILSKDFYHLFALKDRNGVWLDGESFKTNGDLRLSYCFLRDDSALYTYSTSDYGPNSKLLKSLKKVATISGQERVISFGVDESKVQIQIYGDKAFAKCVELAGLKTEGLHFLSSSYIRSDGDIYFLEFWPEPKVKVMSTVDLGTFELISFDEKYLEARLGGSAYPYYVTLAKDKNGIYSQGILLDGVSLKDCPNAIQCEIFLRKKFNFGEEE